MRSRYKPNISHNYEFELDLAPLLAVMVKLVPVLLISSAFVQVMMIETDLPQVVKEAIQREDEVPPAKKTTISLEVHPQKGFRIEVNSAQGTQVKEVPLKENALDLPSLHLALKEIKAENPNTFRIELAPHASITYKEMVKVMDEARKSRDKNLRFQFSDPKTGKDVVTDFMFPDVVFGNVME